MNIALVVKMLGAISLRKEGRRLLSEEALLGSQSCVGLARFPFCRAGVAAICAFIVSKIPVISLSLDAY